jgi:hypothetical protein
MKRAQYGIAGVRSGTMSLKQAEYIWMPYPIREGTNSSLSRLSQASEVNKRPNIPTVDDTHRTVTLSGCSGLCNVKLLILWCPKSGIFIASVANQVEVFFFGEHCDIQDTWIILQQPSVLLRKCVTLFRILLACASLTGRTE